MNIPQNLLYTVDHEWARVEADGSITMGITDFAQESLGGVVYVELPSLGSAVERGATCGQVESTKSVSELFAAATGEVVGRNDQLDSQPELVNSDPYGEGWMLRIMPSASDFTGLMDPASYAIHAAASSH